MKRYSFLPTGIGYNRLVEDPEGEFVRYKDVKEYEQVSPMAKALSAAIKRYDESKEPAPHT